MRKTAISVLLATAMLMGAAVAEQETIISVTGHSWETGGFPPSQMGDVMYAVGLVTDIQEPLIWRPDEYSYTWYMRDLVSIQELVFGSTRVVSYTGGYFTIYKDYYPSNHDYGINPPNATSPSTFTDYIQIYLDGYFVADPDPFTLTLNTSTMSGSFTGTLNFTGGLVYPNLNPDQGWTFGSNIAGVSPQGYDLELNGDVFTMTVAVEASSWSAIKSLYR